MTTLTKENLRQIIFDAGYTFVNEGDYMFDAFVAVWNAAQAEQREAAAKICENLPWKFRTEFCPPVKDDCAARIRSGK